MARTSAARTDVRADLKLMTGTIATSAGPTDGAEDGDGETSPGAEGAGEAGDAGAFDDGTGEVAGEDDDPAPASPIGPGDDEGPLPASSPLPNPRATTRTRATAPIAASGARDRGPAARARRAPFAGRRWRGS
jgi:hypothetical protein